MAIPMCGVPYHAAEGYIARLIQKGYRVAICDQMEEAGAGKKLVKREITRIVTPGTATDAHLLRSHENNYLAAVARNGTPRGPGARRCLDRRVPRHRTGSARNPRRARTSGRARGAVRRRPAAVRRAGQEHALSAHRARRLDLQLRLRRPHAARSFPSALARWLRPRRPARRHLRRRRHPALPARHAARRARSSRPPHALRSRRQHGARRGHGAQSGTDRAGLRRRVALGKSRRCSACSTRPRPAWAAACCGSACCVRRSSRRRSKRGSTRWASCSARRSCARSCASSWRACSIWSGCWPRSRSAAPVRAICSRSASRSSAFRC